MRLPISLTILILVTSCFSQKTLDSLNTVKCDGICNNQNQGQEVILSPDDSYGKDLYVIDVRSDKTAFDLLSTHPYFQQELKSHPNNSPSHFIIPEKMKGKKVKMFSSGSYNMSDYTWANPGFENGVKVVGVFVSIDSRLLNAGASSSNITNAKQAAGANNYYSIAAETFQVSFGQSSPSIVEIPIDAYEIVFSPFDLVLFDNTDENSDLKVIISDGDTSPSFYSSQINININKTFFPLNSIDADNAIKGSSRIFIPPELVGRLVELTVHGGYLTNDTSTLQNQGFAAVAFSDGSNFLNITEGENMESSNYTPGLNDSFKVPNFSKIISNNFSKKTKIRIPLYSKYMHVSAVDDLFFNNKELNADFSLSMKGQW